MQPERWQQIEAIVQSAIDCEPAARAALLDSVCSHDEELRREVESLLAIYESGSATEPSGFEEALRVLERRHEKIVEGLKIGTYRVVKEIGRGGMGTVYLALRDDDVFQKCVAIKIIRRGLDTDDIVRRFRGERQILATLDHPNIARLLDGGATQDGLPYFVMEHIEGEPIDVYCQRRELLVSERLKLFQQVCKAVTYAHQHLIVHRDIKPGNILVTAEGVPRLLDFGIAKLIDSRAAIDRTATALRPLTPEFASPEQVRGEAITTASDIYSLGVLLYLLLTGQSPYKRARSSAAEMEHCICEEEPERPSARVAAAGLRSRLQGDLDNIVLMALRKQRERRYATAEQFSNDIERHLSNRPVIARADTRGYRTAKFIRRNQPLVAASAIIFLVLAGSIAAVTWQAHIAREERDVARLERAKANRINAFLQEMVEYAAVTPGTPNHNAHDATVAEMLDDAAQRVETELTDQPAVRAEMLRTIGGTYLAQGKYDLSARYLREAYDLYIRMYGPDAPQTASVMYPMADLSYMRGNYVEADQYFQKALPAFRTQSKSADFELRRLVGMLSDAAFVKKAIGQTDQAEALWREALSYGPRLPARYRGQAISPKTFLAQLLYMERGDVDQADALANEASRELRAFGGDRFSLAQSLIDLGNVRRLQARYAEAIPLIEEGTRLYAQAQGDGHPNVAHGLTSLAMVEYYAGNYVLAEEYARRSLKMLEKIPKTAHQYTAAVLALGLILNKTSRSHLAEPLLREVVAIREQRYPRKSTTVALALGALGECLAQQRRFAEAEPILAESYQTLKALHVPQSPMLKEAHDRVAALDIDRATTAHAGRF